MAVFKWDWTYHLTKQELKDLKERDLPQALSPAKGFDLSREDVERVIMTKEELKRINEEQDELLAAQKEEEAKELAAAK